MNSSMEIEVSFLDGTDIKSALQDAKSKANLFDVAYVKFDFNGVSFAVRKNGEIQKALDEYRDIHSKKHKHIIC